MADTLERMLFRTQAEWEAWLEKNHETSPGVWLMVAKKGGGQTSVSYAEALDVALCFGWIDGQKGALDEQYFLQRFTRRRKGSPWSDINRGHVARLTEAGRMRPAGQREVDLAKADGRWDAAYAPQSRAQVPEDFQNALDANPAALAAWQGMNSVNRYAILYRIHSVKRAETRQRKIAQYVQMLAEGRRLHD
jgi:uncharacterized protein YdeI (YjbR/CyaY-like superfamily)